jgi:hypothetical protein
MEYICYVVHDDNHRETFPADRRDCEYRRRVREFLRSLPVFAGAIPEFNTSALPGEPVELFQQWLREAVDEGVREPHAMTLSTSDETGASDARILILKDLDEHGWWFATNSESIKGIQLATQPRAALSRSTGPPSLAKSGYAATWSLAPPNSAQQISDRDPPVPAQLPWPARKASDSPTTQPAQESSPNGDAVTPGFEVDTLTPEQYEQRTNELGEQLRHP